MGEEFEKIKENLSNVEQYNDIRNKLSIDIASNTSIIKNLIVKAQDSRIQKNYKNLINSLKEINQTIEKMSRLRVGKYQKMTVSLSRKAVKNKNVDALIKTLHSG